MATAFRNVAVTTAPDRSRSDGVMGGGRGNERRGSGDGEDRQLFQGVALRRREEDGSVVGRRAGSRVLRLFVVLRMEEYQICMSIAMITHRRRLMMLERAENSGVIHSGRWEGGIPVGGGIDFAKSADSPVAAVGLQLSHTTESPRACGSTDAGPTSRVSDSFILRGAAFDSAFQTSFR